MSVHLSATDPIVASLPEATIKPTDLADRLARFEPLAILDVRTDASAAIEAPSATLRHLPASQVLADLDAVSAQLEGPVVVVCDRGVTAAAVADGLRARPAASKHWSWREECVDGSPPCELGQWRSASTASR